MRRSARPIEAIPPRRGADYGGKAQRLAVLARAGFPVPAAWAIPIEAGRIVLRSALGEEGEPEQILRVAARLERVAAMRDRVATAPLPEPVAAALRRAYAALRSLGVESFAVRSSGRTEDAPYHAAAGRYATVLGVRSEAGLLAAARRCFAEALSERAARFAASRADARVFELGLLVQALVPAETAGVCFTADPLTGEDDRLRVEAVWGLGSALADGRLTPDVYELEKGSAQIRDQLLGTKTFRLCPEPRGGLREEPIPESERRSPCLQPEALRALTALAERVERHLRAPQDLEFAFSDGRLYLLQARPLTALPPSTRPRRAGRRGAVVRPRLDGSRTLWSNVNVGEALPEVPTPLTWSVGGAFAEQGFRVAFESLGCSAPEGVRLVSTFRGRLYLNLSAILGTLAQVPGLDPALVLRLGGGERLQLPEPIEPLGSRTSFLLRLPFAASRLARRNLRIGRLVADFERRFQSSRDRLACIDPRVLAPLALDRVLGEALQMLDDAGEVLLVAYGNLLALTVVLHTLLRTSMNQEAERLQRELLTGLSDLEAVAPTLALWRLAERMRQEPSARAWLLEAAEEAKSPTECTPPGPLRTTWLHFLETHGHRGPWEAELAAPRWREEPALLLSALRGHLQAADQGESVLAIVHRRRAVRRRAEEELRGRLPPLAREAAFGLLSGVRRFLRLRERLRDRVVRALWEVRRLALEASARFAGREPDAGEDAAFFLLLEELRSALREELGEVAGRAAVRRSQHARNRAWPAPPPLFVGAPPATPPPPPRDGRLVGHPACAGVVKGQVRKVSRPEQASALRPGEILVLRAADVGLSPLFPVAAAVVTDLGGALSHAAIVLRELGVPAVLGTVHASSTLRTGEWVEVDGSAGIVRRIEEPRT